MCQNKSKTGSFIAYDNSNYWTKVEVSAEVGGSDLDSPDLHHKRILSTDTNSSKNEDDHDNDYLAAALSSEGNDSSVEQPTYVFNYHNLVIASLTQAMPTLCGLILVAYAFKFALMAGMNQGCIPSLFSVTSIYIAILFYFAFGEVISKPKIVGIAMMIPCVILLSLDKKVADQESDVTVHDMQIYGGIAVLFAVLAPLFWTTKAYFARKSIEAKLFITTRDLALDSALFHSSSQTVLFCIYLWFNSEGVSFSHFLQGQLTGAFFLLGGIFAMKGIETGPGGPVNALMSTQIIYQTTFNAIALDQGISVYELTGIAAGLFATCLITMCDPSPKPAASTANEKIDDNFISMSTSSKTATNATLLAVHTTPLEQRSNSLQNQLN